MFGNVGTNTASLVAGGKTPPGVHAQTETWNGSNWTEVADLNDSRESLAVSGTSTAALAAGGESPGYTANTEEWNGASWVEVANLNLARGSGGNTGSTSSSIYAGGTSPPGSRSEAEEWSGSSNTTKVLTD